MLKIQQYLLIKDDVFALDERIRYFGFLDNRQGMIISEMRRKGEQATVGYDPEQQLLRELTFFKGVMSTWSIHFGHVNYSVVVHEGSKLIMIPVESGLAIITTEADYPVQGVELISKLVKEKLAESSKT